MPNPNKPPVRSLAQWPALLPLAVFGLMSGAVIAQTGTPPAPAASMAQGHMQGGAMRSGGAGAHDMRQSMMSGMEGMQKMPMSGDVDRDFAMMMKMHHQQAVSMAEMELAHGKSKAMKDMARKIIAAQKKEIAMFDRWLAEQK